MPWDRYRKSKLTGCQALVRNYKAQAGLDKTDLAIAMIASAEGDTEPQSRTKRGVVRYLRVNTPYRSEFLVSPCAHMWSPRPGAPADTFKLELPPAGPSRNHGARDRDRQDHDHVPVLPAAGPVRAAPQQPPPPRHRVRVARERRCP
eukprot:SAG22_NODE_48_length_24654_cov_4.406394_19_plen_147_part_00